MKYNVHKLASMLNQFILDYAQRFSIPELAKLDHTNIDATKEDSGFIVVRVKDPIPFCPSGQFASLVILKERQFDETDRVTEREFSNYREAVDFYNEFLSR